MTLSCTLVIAAFTCAAPLTAGAYTLAPDSAPAVLTAPLALPLAITAPEQTLEASESIEIARQGRGRGRGRGGDRDRDDDRDRTRDRDRGDDQGDSGSGRSKPRIPGGSGCDDAHDIAEHPECSG